MCVHIYTNTYIHTCTHHKPVFSGTQQYNYRVDKHCRTHGSDRCQTHEHSEHRRTRVHPHGMRPQCQIPEHKCRTQTNTRSHRPQPKARRDWRTMPNTAEQSADHSTRGDPQRPAPRITHSRTQRRTQRSAEHSIQPNTLSPNRERRTHRTRFYRTLGYTYVCVHTHVCVYMYMYVYIYIYIHIYMYISLSLYIYIYIYVLYVCTYIYIYVYI